MEIIKKAETDVRDNVKPLLRKYANTVPTFVYAVLDQYIDGEVYADDSAQPASLIIKAPNSKFYVCGKPSSEAMALLKTIISGKDCGILKLFSASEGWDQVIETHMPAESMKKTERTWLPFDASGFDLAAKEDAADGRNTDMRPLTKDLIRLSDAYPESYYNQNWGSLTAFLKNGFGYGIISTGRIAAECTSVYRSRHYAEAAVYTGKAFRRHGFAHLLMNRFVATCVAKGLIPRWDCDTSNFASMKLARKLGFKQGSVYSLYEMQR